MPWTPESSSATVREPSGRTAAFSLSSANSDSKFFTPPSLLAPGAGTPAGALHDGGDVRHYISNTASAAGILSRRGRPGRRPHRQKLQLGGSAELLERHRRGQGGGNR